MVATVKAQVSASVSAQSDVLVGDDDFTHSSVPASQRRDAVTMGLLWITMVTGFPSVLAGFEWYKQGLSISQVFLYAGISIGVMLLYAVPACLLGAKSGLTYALLSRKAFGKWGSRLVSFNLVWIALLWYGLTALFMAEGLKGIYNIPLSTAHLASVFAILMAFNNFFGFSGVANFARYAAGPILILLVGFTFAKASFLCPSTVWHAPSTVAGPYALTMVSSFIIGYASWGNEADYWRFAKPKTVTIAIPLMVALTIGQIIFPLTGWMLANITGATDPAAAMHVIDKFAFNGTSIIAALVLAVCYFAVNDSCLYASINSLENITSLPRKTAVTFLTLAGAASAFWLSGVSKNFEQVASLSCIFLPAATVVILCHHVVQTRLFRQSYDVTHVPSFASLPAIRWQSVTALLLGCTVGVLTAGIIPGLDVIHIGVPALQAWIVTAIAYFVLALPKLLSAANQYTSGLTTNLPESSLHK